MVNVNWSLGFTPVMSKKYSSGCPLPAAPPRRLMGPLVLVPPPVWVRVMILLVSAAHSAAVRISAMNLLVNLRRPVIFHLLPAEIPPGVNVVGDIPRG